VLTSLGKVSLKKDHPLCKGTSRFGMSERVRVLLCHMGQALVYEEVSEFIKELINVDIAPCQIQRLCNYYGNLMDPLIEANCEAVLPKIKAKYKEDSTYVMMDGSMVFTREDKWREMKLCRIFFDSQLVDIQQDRREILRSIYVSHLGSVAEFFPKLERFLVHYRKMVILGDGAKWIWNWAEDNYPGAVQILDYYHAKEKLVLFAKHQFCQDQDRKEWVKSQEEKLLNNQAEQVIETLKKYRSKNDQAKIAKQKAIDYYIEHEDRMEYKTYREKGLLIGSGPIEAAHRNVIQQRMKLSGQKWTIKGANAMANLRCYKYSGAWEIIKNVIANAA